MVDLEVILDVEFDPIVQGLFTKFTVGAPLKKCGFEPEFQVGYGLIQEFRADRKARIRNIEDHH